MAYENQILGVKVKVQFTPMMISVGVLIGNCAVSFFTLVTFDEHQIGLPVAWCIQHSESAEHIGRFLQAVKDNATHVQPDWYPSCFIIDCAEAEMSAITAVFPRIPIYFCSWHVRRLHPNDV